MTAAKTGFDGVINPQPVAAPLTRSAIFLVVTINPGPDHRSTVRSFCADLPALFRAVEFRNLEAGLTCVMGIGSEAWDRLFGHPRPAELHPFQEIRAGSRHAISSPGDLLFHIRAKRMDLCFELATRIMASLGGAVSGRVRRWASSGYWRWPSGQKRFRPVALISALRLSQLTQPDASSHAPVSWRRQPCPPWNTRTTGSRAGRLLRLPACPAVVNFICHLPTNRCQFENLPLDGGVFRGFGKLPIFRRLLPEII